MKRIKSMKVRFPDKIMLTIDDLMQELEENELKVPYTFHIPKFFNGAENSASYILKSG